VTLITKAGGICYITTEEFVAHQPLRRNTWAVGDIAGDLLSSFSRNAIRDATDRLTSLPDGSAPGATPDELASSCDRL
jgi:hypothetical protein